MENDTKNIGLDKTNISLNEKEEEDTLGSAPIAADVLDEEDDIFGGDEDPLGDFSLDPAEEERLAAQKAAELEAQKQVLPLT